MHKSVQPISTALLDFVQHAVTAPSADNSQPWLFSRREGTVDCVYRHVGSNDDPFGSNGHATLLAAGALQENIDRLLLILQMPQSKRSIDAVWTITFDTPDRDVPASAELDAILNRHTNRFPYRAVKPGALGQLVSDMSGTGCRLVALEDRSMVRGIGDAIKLCAEVRFNTKILHEWLFDSLRWSRGDVERGDGLDLATVHLPPGGRQFMRLIAPWPRMSWLNRLGLYKLLAAQDTAPIYRAPCVIAIVGDSSRDGAWAAGRLLQALWIELNRQSYAVHPYYVVSDLINRLDARQLEAQWQGSVQTAKSIASDVLGLGPGEQVHMLLRVGQPGHPVIRSRRRNADSFIE